jgi:hypothetical protein
MRDRLFLVLARDIVPAGGRMGRMASEFVEVITVEQPYRCPRHEPVKALLDERDISFPRLGGKHSLGRGPACAPGSPVTAHAPVSA